VARKKRDTLPQHLLSKRYKGRKKKKKKGEKKKEGRKGERATSD
jgi:hypothetical protein